MSLYTSHISTHTVNSPFKQLFPSMDQQQYFVINNNMLLTMNGIKGNIIQQQFMT